MTAIPVFLLTGFLGSGKTTLLGRLLKDASFARTAVVINEFGEIGLDHELIETSEESFVTLQTGCLCCAVRDDLVLTLEDLLRRRAAGSVPSFERVVIETSGLADPAPILHALMTDEGFAGRLAVAGVVTTVDAVNGPVTLERHPEAIKQVAVADRVVLTKTDLVQGQSQEVAARVTAINPTAAVIAASFGAVDAADVFGDDGFAGERAVHDMERRLTDGLAGREPKGHKYHHHAASDITCVSLIRDQPISAIALTLLLEVLAEHCGGDLLRLKGIVHVAENPGTPAVVHGVQHVFHPPEWLARWPSEDRRSRLVLIGRNLRGPWIEALLDAVEAEVAEVHAEQSRNT
jgi:G3E family GTPase